MSTTPTEAAGPGETTVPWPDELVPIFGRALATEYASLTRSGAPMTVPVTPYIGEDGLTLDVSTGLTYPVKAERARRNPKVALLFSDPLGSGLEHPPVALVQGLATVRDADIQANTDRYVRLALAKAPEAFAGQPRFLLRTLTWYFARIWVQVTPTRIRWWPEGRLDRPPLEWTAPAGTAAPPSDPAQAGGRRPAVLEPRPDWRSEAARAANELPMRDLTVVDADGFPLAVPVRELEPTARGFRLRTAEGIEIGSEGPACLTLHTHSVPFTSQQNRTFMGRLSAGGDGGTEMEVERLVPDWSLPTGKLSATVDFLRKGRRLRPRLRLESARRGQSPPVVRLP